MKQFLSTCILLFGFSFAHAYTGNQLLNDIEGNNSQRYAALLYIQGVAEASPDICPPNEVTLGQLRDISQSFLKENPEVRHLKAVNILTYLLNKRFPCTTNPSKPVKQTY